MSHMKHQSLSMPQCIVTDTISNQRLDMAVRDKGAEGEQTAFTESITAPSTTDQCPAKHVSLN